MMTEAAMIETAVDWLLSPTLCATLGCVNRVEPLLAYEEQADEVRAGYCRECWGAVAP